VTTVAATKAGRVDPAVVVILAGVAAALHVGKLAPAIPLLRAALDVTLVQAGFLLSAVQVAGMLLGLAFGVVADGLGGRRSMLLGLGLLSLASLGGGAAPGVAVLLALRVLEGFGFLLVALPAPGLLRQLVAPGRVNQVLGIWGAYMPLATALALLIGPLCMAALGWRAWWWLLAGVSLAMALWLAQAVPAAVVRPAPPASPSANTAADPAWLARLRQTLAAPGPWLVALAFAAYSSQWLAVIGFLPSIYTQAGVSGAATGVLTALAAAVNIVGNVGSGRLLQRGAHAPWLLATGFGVMALAAAAAFAQGAGPGGWGLPPALRYAAVLLFSGVGGLIPATLFTLALRLAPSERTLSTTVGWVQQWSSLGQFAGPPAVAWVASVAGGWQFTWVATGTCSALGLLLTALLAGCVRRVRCGR
jgi:CP family cyanate transporter-like MFS transporter